MAALIGFGMWGLTIYGLYRLAKRLFGRKRVAVLPVLAGPDEGFKPVIWDAMCRDRWGIALDPTNNRLAVSCDGQRRVLNFEQIIRVEPMLNGVPMSQGGGQAGMIGGAIVGDMLGGALGGIIGMGIAGARIQSLSIRLLTDDLAQPWLDVMFLDEKRPQFQSNKRVQAALGMWKMWEGRLATIVARAPMIVAEERPIRQFVA